MGLQDRSYYGDQGKDPWSTDPDAWKGGSSGSKGRSIILILIIINVVIFLLDAFTPIPQDQLASYNLAVENFPEEASDIQKPSRWLSSTMALKPDVVQKPWNVWQFLTHGFAHASIDSKSSFFHVGFNMLTLFFLGRPVLKKYGRDEFLRFYLMAIVVSGLGWVAAQWIAGTPNSSAVGASGAVSAVIALFVMNFWDETIYVFGAVGMKAWVLAAILIFLDLLRVFDASNQVAWEAHLTGMAFGAAYFQFKWDFFWMKFGWLASLTSPKPKLRVHDPGAKDELFEKQANEILEKITREGLESLTAKENRLMKKYSRIMKEKKNRE